MEKDCVIGNYCQLKYQRCVYIEIHRTHVNLVLFFVFFEQSINIFLCFNILDINVLLDILP